MEEKLELCAQDILNLTFRLAGVLEGEELDEGQVAGILEERRQAIKRYEELFGRLGGEMPKEVRENLREIFERASKEDEKIARRLDESFTRLRHEVRKVRGAGEQVRGYMQSDAPYTGIYIDERK